MNFFSRRAISTSGSSVLASASFVFRRVESTVCLTFRYQSGSTTNDNSTASEPAPGKTGGDYDGPLPQRAMFTPFKLRASSMRRHAAPTATATVESQHVDELLKEESPFAMQKISPSESGGSLSSSEEAQMARHASERIDDVNAPSNMTGLNEVQVFLEQVEQQTEMARFQRNQSIPYPEHPDKLVPEFRRIKRHQKQEILEPSATEDRPRFTRRDIFVSPPPSPQHPWVGPHTPIGEHIVHGDGQLNIVGTGDVGFEDGLKDGAAYDKDSQEARKSWRGLKHRSVIHCALPRLNASVYHDVIVKHSFSLTGRGVFATKAIPKGETIMICGSTSRSLGVKGETERLEEMCIHILRKALEEEDKEFLDFLHDWILTGQPSSLLEHWPKASTERVIEAIGGLEKLYSLELHPIHISRMAAIMDLNSFLVESAYAERKGMAYFPEAGFFNHSCVPNASYEIMPEQAFQDSDYCVDELAKQEREEDAAVESASKALVETTGSGEKALSPSAQKRAHDRLVALTSGKGNELTEAEAPEYLFCCRAERDIAPGEEILIAYVPPEWSFDNRQYVLHDRYHFYCKCPRCAPTIESQYARIPRLLVVLVVISVSLQLFLIRLRNRAANRFDDEGNFVNDESASQRMGLFEVLQKEQIDESNSYPGMERLPSHIRDDYSRK